MWPARGRPGPTVRTWILSLRLVTVTQCQPGGSEVPSPGRRRSGGARAGGPFKFKFRVSRRPAGPGAQGLSTGQVPGIMIAGPGGPLPVASSACRSPGRIVLVGDDLSRRVPSRVLTVIPAGRDILRGFNFQSNMQRSWLSSFLCFDLQRPRAGTRRSSGRSEIRLIS